MQLCYRAALLLALGLVHQNPAYAKDGQTDVEEIVVTAAPLDDILQSSSILTGDELRRKTALSLGETLANELGISSTYFGPAASRPIIRGIGGSRVTMLTDSVSTLDVSDVSPDHGVTVEPLLADQIEIIRGPTTLLYGSSATGGVINVADSRIPEKIAEKLFSGALELRGDSAAEERTAVGRLDGGWKSLAWHLDGVTRETEDVDIAGFATKRSSEREAEERKGRLNNSYSETDTYSAGLSWVDERGYLGASFSRLENTYGLPGPELEEEEEESDEPPRFPGPFLDMEQNRIDARGELRLEGSPFELLKFAYGHNDYEHQEIEPSGEVATTFENDAWQARFEAVHAPLLGWHGVIGLQYDDREFSAVGEEAFVAPTDHSAIGGFIVEETDFAWGHLHLGVRFESNSFDNAMFRSIDKFTVSTGAGLEFELPQNAAITVNVSRNERAPSLEELYSNGAHIATRQFERGLLSGANNRVKVETSSNFEVALSKAFAAFQFDLNVYYNEIDDFVYQALDGSVEDGLPVAQYTQDDARFYGFEMAALAPIFTNENFGSSVRLFTDYVRAELTNGDDLPRIPPWRMGLNFEFSTAQWQAGFDVIHHARQGDISSFNTDSFTMVNLNALYRLPGSLKNWEVFARATNLADENARRSTSFLAANAPLPGRSAHFGLRLRF